MIEKLKCIPVDFALIQSIIEIESNKYKFRIFMFFLKFHFKQAGMRYRVKILFIIVTDVYICVSQGVLR